MVRLMADQKMPGKTPWAGRRRPATRKSGFKSTTPIRIQIVDVPAFKLEAGEQITLTFAIDSTDGDRVGFGVWYGVKGTAEISVEEAQGSPKTAISEPGDGDWGKVGNQWVTRGLVESPKVTFAAKTATQLSLYKPEAGRINHPHLQSARSELLQNMSSFAPEANFYEENSGFVSIAPEISVSDLYLKLHLKTCNRCGRFLPINIPNERAHLSFSSHCVARRPCVHSGFGKIEDMDSDRIHELEYGFQLECRFCKKFEVNAAHNPQRTADQMKEDGTRRRAFELLLEHLYEGSAQLNFKKDSDKELTSLIFERFDGRCFKCHAQLATKHEMHLDHTRPLALLWPLDETATALCKQHNLEKRDRPPSEYYSGSELRDLAMISGLPLKELENPNANSEAIDLLGARLDWFFESFLNGPDLQKVRDGKRSSDLLLKALDRAIGHYPGGAPFRIIEEAKRRGWKL